MVIALDNYSRIILTVIAVLLTLIVIPLWTDNINPDSQALAARTGIPDSGQQMNELIEIMKQNSETLEKIAAILENQTLKVEIQNDTVAPSQ